MNWVSRGYDGGCLQVEIGGKYTRLLDEFIKVSSPPTPRPPPPSGSKISPAVLFVIVILAVIVFLSGAVHLLIKFVIKRHSSLPPSHSNGGYQRGLSGSEALQRQLQQLFHLHDSGLEQAVIDALPVFLYRELLGAKEPFDCAVCLCEFGEEDKLRLLPACSHAFHINCIDTWLLSNSSCPLCRGGLFIPAIGLDNAVIELEQTREDDDLPTDLEDGLQLPNQKPAESDADPSRPCGIEDKMVFSVRLGKLKSFPSETGDSGNIRELEGEFSSSSSSSSNGIDARRCYSMGSYQYVEGGSFLRVTLNRNWDGRSGRKKGVDLNSGADEALPGKRLLFGSKGESFSVSKIWQWSGRKGKLPISIDRASLERGLSWSRKDGDS